MVTKVAQITDNVNSYLTSTTAVEDIRAYLLTLANQVAKALNLKVMPKLTRELQYGGAYYLGENENAEYPLMMVTNAQYKNHAYDYAYIGGVNKLGYQYGYTSYFNTAPSSNLIPSSNYAGYLGVWIRTDSNSESYNTYITIKKYKNVTAFSFFNKNDGWDNKYYFYLQDVKNKKLFSSILGTSCTFYIGYTPALNNIDNSPGSYEIMDGNNYSSTLLKSLTPENQDILQDLYIVDRQHPSSFKIFTNKTDHPSNSIITLENKTYHIVWRGLSTCCLVVDITGEIEEASDENASTAEEESTPTETI